MATGASVVRCRRICHKNGRAVASFGQSEGLYRLSRGCATPHTTTLAHDSSLPHPRRARCPLHQTIVVSPAAHCLPRAPFPTPSTRPPPPPALSSTCSTPSAARTRAIEPPASPFSRRTRRTPRLPGMRTSTSRRRHPPRQTPRPPSRLLHTCSASPGAPPRQICSDPTSARTIACRRSQSPMARSRRAS